MVQVKTSSKFLLPKKKNAIIISAFIIASLAFFALGVVLEREEFSAKVFKPILKTNFRILANYFSSMTAEPEKLLIDMKHENFQKIAYQRERAFAEKKLFARSDDLVPATITYEGKPVKVKMRLKGDHLDHLNTSKWSYRVKVRGDNTIMGMKTFSLHTPETRSFMNEWFYHKVLKNEGIVGLRYKFVDVIFNGKDLGIYALEEHFGKRLIENNQNREGPIVRFNENLMWKERVQQGMGKSEKNGSGSYYSSDVDSFHTGKTLEDPKMAKLFNKAVTLLEAFRAGEISTSEAFDVKKLAKFFALSDLLGAQHGTIWHNLRFYYNPVSSKLEPIAFDGNTGKYVRKLAFRRPYQLHKSIFSDLDFFEEYIKTLKRVKGGKYLNDIFDSFDGEIKSNLKILHKDYPMYDFSKKAFYKNKNYIATVLDPIKAVHAFYNGSLNDNLKVRVGNIQSLPVEIIGLSYAAKNSSANFETEAVTLLGKKQEGVTKYKELSFKIPPGFKWSDEKLKDLKIVYKLLGTGEVKEEKVFAWSNLDYPNLAADLIRTKANAASFQFIRINERAKTISMLPGSHSLNRNLVIPKGYKFIVVEGTKIDLLNKAKILSYSPVEFLGSPEKPVIVESTDGSGQGLLVISAAHPSSEDSTKEETYSSWLENVIFRGLSNPEQAEWSVTGSVTFFESPVMISNVLFESNKCEDALNIVRSNFVVKNSEFSDTFSDAFDGDFVKGKIMNSRFLNSGNDAIDISGSSIRVSEVEIIRAGDKGLSAGENSFMKVNDIIIKDVELAVASKDMSETEIDNITIENTKVAFTAYQKKPEFGPGFITVHGLKMSKVDKKYLIEDSSAVTVNGKTVKSKEAKVKDKLYGAMYGMKTKR